MEAGQEEQIGQKLGELVDLVRGYASEGGVACVRQVFGLLSGLFGGQRDDGGRPYLLHPLEVAIILAGMQQDVPSLVAALAHDCRGRSQPLPPSVLEEIAGKEAVALLKGLERLQEIDSRSQDLEQADAVRRMVISEAGDLRTLILHIADHYQIMSELDLRPPLERKKILERSVKVYTPLASRLGMHRLKSRLEDLSFKYTNPEEYEKIVNALSNTKLKREKYVAEVSGLISSMLAERGIDAEVTGRVKHIYSIYQKMLRQNVTVEGIYDIIAFRVMVDSEPRCWEVLGAIHSTWSPIPGRFKDYLTIPKKNGYRSLHTSVMGPKGEKIEIQIRTWQMHRVAEEGVAAHWRYKEGGKKVAEAEERQLRWITSHLADGEEGRGREVFSEEIYVFTPAGAVIALPQGATPLDFAYAIHTSVGHRCSAALVNGVMVPLAHTLKSGDLVKIITKPGQHPSKDWLDIVRTSRARAKIRSYLGAVTRREQVEKGKQILEKYLKEMSLSLHKMEKKGRFKKVLEELRVRSMEEIYLRIASSRLRPQEVYEILSPPEKVQEETAGEEKIFADVQRDSGEVRIGEIGNLMVRFAGCCRPLPGDEVRGFVTRGRGVTIHRRLCQNLQAADSERVIDIKWEMGKGVKTRAGLRITTDDQPAVLAKLTQFISSKGFNVTYAKSEKSKDGAVRNLFTFEISSTQELLGLIRALERLSGVQTIERV